MVQYLDLGGRKEFNQYYFQNTLLIMLLILHIYWWILICRMLAKMVQDSGKVSEDVRSGMSLLVHLFVLSKRFEQFSPRFGM